MSVWRAVSKKCSYYNRPTPRSTEGTEVSGVRLGSQLVKLGHLSEEQLVDFLGKQYRLPAVILKNLSPDPEIVKLIPINVVQKYHAIPFDRNGATLKVAMTDPANIFAVDDLKFLTGYSIEVYVTRRIRSNGP